MSELESAAGMTDPEEMDRLTKAVVGIFGPRCQFLSIVYVPDARLQCGVRAVIGGTFRSRAEMKAWLLEAVQACDQEDIPYEVLEVEGVTEN